MFAHYLKRILTARVYDVAHETPLELAKSLSERLGNTVLLKREDLQPVFSFKLRGAYNKMAHLTTEQLERGVIAASAGNHAQGVALSAQRLNCRAVIVMPTTTPTVKIDAVKSWGAEVVLHGDSYSDAYTRALDIEKAEGLTFVHPFDDPDVIAGQGTVAMEILRQYREQSYGGRPIAAIFAAIGGGGLVSGVAAYIKQIQPEIKVIGVQTEDSDAMAQSIKAGHRVELQDVGLFSDGTAVKIVGSETFKICQALVDEIVLVNTDDVCAAIKDVYKDTRSIVEPAGALSIAGAKVWAQQNAVKDHVLIPIACGANMNFDRLRFVSERAELGEHREAIFAVTIPEERGSFRRFCEIIGPRNVTEFNYRISAASAAHVFVGIETPNRSEAQAIAASLNQVGFHAIELTTDEMAKLHVRYMVGGRSPLAHDERVFRFEFPERPGALMRFLSRMSPNWNISLFHYRNHGADYGRILVGLQAPPEEHSSLDAFLDSMGFPYQEESDNPAYRLFLGS